MPPVADLLAALGLLTPLPCRRPDPQSAAGARATLFFPVVGGLFGATLYGLDALLAARLPLPLTVILLLAAWEGLARHPRPRTARRIVVTVLTVALKATALSMLGTARHAALLFAPLLGAWSLVVLAVGARDAAMPARKFNGAITFREFALTSVLSAGAVLTLAEAAGILVFVCAAAAVVLLRLLLHRRRGGVSWELLWMSAQGIEALVLVLFALL